MHKLLLILSLSALATTAAVANDPGDPADIYKSQPVGPSLSADDANDYVDSVVKSWLAFKLPDPNPKLGPQDMIKLAIGVKRLGITNLIAAYGHTAPDDLYHMIAQSNPKDYIKSATQDYIKRAILEKALSLTATASDLNALLGLYDSRPLILQVLNDHPEWDNDTRVSDFLTTHLDQLPEAYNKSDMAPLDLLLLAARSPVPAVQTKFESVIADTIQNEQNYRNKHIYLDLLTVPVYSQTSSPVIAKHLPDLFTVLASRAKIQTSESDIYNEVFVSDVFERLRGALAWGKPWKGDITAACVALFSDPKSKDAINKMAEAAEADRFNGVMRTSVLVPAAACGSKSALKQLTDFYHDSNSNAPAGSVNGERNFVKKYLETINCLRDGDKITEIIDHVSAAVYDPAACTWTIPKDADSADDGGIAPPTTTSLTPPAEAPVPSATTNAPPTSAPHAEIKVPAPKVMIAIVTKKTLISTVTPSGGHAAVPLDVGTKLAVVSINPDGTITAQTDYRFQGQIPQDCVHLSSN